LIAEAEEMIIAGRRNSPFPLQDWTNYPPQTVRQTLDYRAGWTGSPVSVRF
jgi:hypothetical protein